MLTRNWQRASGNSGNCFEVRLAMDPVTGRDTVEVRNSRHPDGAVVRYSRTEWRAALRAFKRGMFDLDTHRPTSALVGPAVRRRRAGRPKVTERGRGNSKPLE